MKPQLRSSIRIWTLPFVLVILILLASTGIVDALQAALPVLIRQSGGSSTLGSSLRQRSSPPCSPGLWRF